MGFLLALLSELLTALLRLLFLPIIFLLALLLWLWELIVRFWRIRNLYPEEGEEGCRPLPESIIRRPDPCIYSQGLLMAQGVPVTWNNPDIWIAPRSNPAAVMPDSYHLSEDTDYLVTVRVHNASTDAALGVRVRLRFRSWGFNIPDLLPVETGAMGQEISRFVDVAPMGSSQTVFNWHTPRLAPGEVRHYCLQASLEHPLDINTANNVGQENSNVYAANPGHVTPGEIVTVAVPLYNDARRVERFHFDATMYQVDEQQRHVLRLRSNPGYRRWSLAQRIANIIPTLVPGGRSGERIGSTYRLSFLAQRRLMAIRTRYTGLEAVRERLRSLDVKPPRNMAIRAAGRELTDLMELGPDATAAVEFTVAIPADARPGALLPLNLVARKANGVLVGGVTLLLQVKE